MKIGFTCGVWDLLHAGHVIFLSECASECDRLIVGLQTDPTIDRPQKNKPIQSTFERWTQLYFLKGIWSIIPYDTEKDLENIISINDINIRFIDFNYKDTTITAYEMCEMKGIEMKYLNRFHSYSSTELRKRIFNVEKENNVSV